ncbi:hypothetical protein T4A_4029 [Trichinella pseudospiralis]|uniref:Uncharacterized protein n=1 Tax=Trichinella pseudospiralis TaxID=6337 RepID=A0A0V1E769_TRIPS|nr:hypothetical protein T4A_4029 [Trichinella pseudospiralis]
MDHLISSGRKNYDLGPAVHTAENLCAMAFWQFTVIDNLAKQISCTGQASWDSSLLNSDLNQCLDSVLVIYKSTVHLAKRGVCLLQKPFNLSRFYDSKGKMGKNYEGKFELELYRATV